MTDKKNERRGQNRTHYREGRGAVGFAREYSYVLHLSPDDCALLDSYRTALASGSARFAEVHYNYLHDNPDIADVLYAHERGGGNAGELIRSELALILGVFSPHETDARERALVEAGRAHLHRGIRPVWITGAYRLFLEYVLRLVRELPATAEDRDRLEAILLRQIMRDHGLMIEGYWHAMLETARNEIAHATGKYLKVEELLAGLPHMLWTVNVENNSILYANRQLHALYDPLPEAPIPFVDDTHAEDRELLLTAWSRRSTAARPAQRCACRSPVRRNTGTACCSIPPRTGAGA
jgi:hypothetical protein